MRRPSATRATRGFTLIEMMISVVLGALIVLAAVAFASHEVRTLALSNQVLELSQMGRAVTDMIGEDLTNAGMGVGYEADGTFGGLTLGTVTRAGGTFDSTNRAITVDGVATTTDDLVVAMADGATASIVVMPGRPSAGRGFPGAVQVCAPGPAEVGFQVDERVLARDAFGLAAASFYVTRLTPTACAADVTCTGGGGCVDVELEGDPLQWTSDATAADADYARGQLIGNFRQVVWFVDPTRAGRLRRYVATRDVVDCSARTCGAIVAEGVESLQFRVWARETTGVWTDVTGTTGVDDNRPLRVDLEIAMRSRTADTNNTLHDPARLLLETTGAPVCIPGTCAQTLLRREVFRSTSELKNSGYMRLNGGAS